MNCPECGQEIEGVNHNDRGWRCENCWAFLGFEWSAKSKPKTVEKTEPKAEEEPADKPKPKPAPKVPRRTRK